MGLRARDPELVAPVGSYLSDGIRLMCVLEVDASGALGEDCGDLEQLIELTPRELTREWRRIIPLDEKQAALPGSAAGG